MQLVQDELGERPSAPAAVGPGERRIDDLRWAGDALRLQRRCGVREIAAAVETVGVAAAGADVGQEPGEVAVTGRLQRLDPVGVKQVHRHLFGGGRPHCEAATAVGQGVCPRPRCRTAHAPASGASSRHESGGSVSTIESDRP